MTPCPTLSGKGEVLGPALVLSAASNGPRFPATNIQYLTWNNGAWPLLWQDLGSKDQEMVNYSPT